MRVAIIGAGVIGVGIGRELSGRGVEVEVLEAAYPESGASGRSIGVSSVQQKDPRLARLAMEGIGISREIDRVLKEEFNMPTGVMGEQVPHASIALSEQDRARLSRYFEYWRAAGAEAREMSPREVKEELMPWIDEGSFVSAFVTFSDFKLMYFPLVSSGIMMIRSRGGVVRRKSRVVGFDATGSRVRAALLEGGRRVEADAYVVAAGARSAELAAALGDAVPPIRVAQAGALVTEPYKYQFRPVVTVDSKGYRFTQTLRKEFVASVYDMGYDNEGFSVDESLRVLERLATVTVKLFPSFSYMNVLRQWGAYLDYALDGLPIVGWSQRYENLYYAYGFGNYGFSVGPAAARRAAREIADGGRDPELEPLRPGRGRRGAAHISGPLASRAMVLAAKLFRLRAPLRPDVLVPKLRDFRLEREDAETGQVLVEEIRGLEYGSGFLSATVLKDRPLVFRRRDDLVKTVRTIEVPFHLRLEGGEQLLLVLAKKGLANEVASDLSRIMYGSPKMIVEARLSHEKFRRYFEGSMEDARVIYFDQVDLPNVGVLALYGESLRDSALYHEYLEHGKIWYVVVTLPSRGGLTVGVTRNAIIAAFGRATAQDLVDFAFGELAGLLEEPGAGDGE
jgi:D-amino-acid dehydrogenase